MNSLLKTRIWNNFSFNSYFSGNTKKCVVESLVSGNGKSLKSLQLNRNAFGIQTNFSSIGVLIAENMKQLRSLKLEFNTTPEGLKIFIKIFRTNF